MYYKGAVPAGEPSYSDQGQGRREGEGTKLT